MNTAVNPDRDSLKLLRQQAQAWPEPGENDVLVRIEARWKVSHPSVREQGGQRLIDRLACGLRHPRPSIVGTEFAGVVEAVGTNVERFQPGDAVFGAKGGPDDYRYVSQDGILAIKPDSLNWQKAAVLASAGTTALTYLRDGGNVRSGQCVLILGASGTVGSLAVQIAKSLGASVTGVCATANIEFVYSLGADKVIDYTLTDYTLEDYSASAERYDVVLDVAGRSSFSQCAAALKPKGVYLRLARTWTLWLQAMMKRRTTGRRACFFCPEQRPAEAWRHDLADLREMVESGVLVVGKAANYVRMS